METISKANKNRILGFIPSFINSVCQLIHNEHQPKTELCKKSLCEGRFSNLRNNPQELNT